MREKNYHPSAIGRMLTYIPTGKLFYPFYLARQLYYTQEEYASRSLPPEWDGFTIAYASDIHLGPMFKKNRAIDIAEKINALNADIILLGGDYGETTQTSIDFFHVIPELKAKHGVLAAIGNHDLHGTDAEIEELRRVMASKHITLLRNECYVLKGKEADIRFCSTDDTRLGLPDPGILHAKKDDVRQAFTVFFPHSPDILPDLLSDARKHFDVAICGHTHGGQIALFGHSLHSSSKYGDRYRSGWKRENNHDIFISNGVGTSLMPIRLGAPPQYHKITLKRIKP